MEMEIETGPISNYARNKKIPKQTVMGNDKAEMYVREEGSDYADHSRDSPTRLQDKLNAALLRLMEKFKRDKLNTARSSSINKQ